MRDIWPTIRNPKRPLMGTRRRGSPGKMTGFVYSIIWFIIRITGRYLSHNKTNYGAFQGKQRENIRILMRGNTAAFAKETALQKSQNSNPARSKGMLRVVHATALMTGTTILPGCRITGRTAGKPAGARRCLCEDRSP
jgi:hypothetical protein